MDLVNNTLVNDSNGLLPDVNGKETEPSISPATRKGYGLKKWRRIKRDATKGGGGDSSDEAGNIAMHDLSNSVRNPSKRSQVLPEKSEGSVSSPNPIAGNSIDAGGTESENSEDQSSKSSTAVSVPKMRYEFSNNDKNGMSSLSGSNFTQHHQQQGKGRVEPSKKARGVKIEKENSHSSLESDLRSSNFVFVQGAYVSNGKGSEGLENGHGDYLPWDGKKEKGGNHGSSSDQDAIVESIIFLQKAQEALEEEVLKFKEIGKDGSEDGSISDYENVSSFSRMLQSEVLETAKRDAEAELEDLFKQRIETEIEYLTISRAIQKLSIADVNINTISKEQKSTASKLTENKTKENSTAMPQKDADKFKKLYEDIASGDETMKLQKGVCKYTSYFLIQLLSLFIIVGIFLFGLSPDYVEVVPT